MSEAYGASPGAANAERHDVSDVIRSHRAFVSRSLLRAGVAARDLADAEQEVFLVVQRRLAEFEGRARITTWLCRIALYVASDFRRRAHRRHEVLDGCSLDSRDLTVDAHQALEQQETFRLALDALERLAHDKRDVFLLYELEELSMTEIAQHVGVPLKTAFSRLYAARRELRLLLQKDGVSLGLWPLLSPRRTWHVWFEGARLPLRTLSVWQATAGSALCCVLALVQGDQLSPVRSQVRVQPMAASALLQPLASSTRLPPSAAETLRAASDTVPLPSSFVRPASLRKPARARAKPASRTEGEVPALQATADNELQVYRISEVDMPAPRVLPFGFDEVEAPPRALSRIELRGPVDAADGVERALR